MDRVDLHTHTTASDGTLPPRALVRAAARRGVGILAITDHDSTAGLADASAEAATQPSMTIVPGLEINCDADGAEVHVLGYLLDHEAAWFQAFLREQRAERAARIHRIVARLAELGLPLDAAEVFAVAGEAAAGRPHVATAMIKRGYVRSVREAFDRYLKWGAPAYVSRRHLPPADAVRVIRKARGVPVLAHPGLAHRDDLLPSLVDAGLMGIETYYPEHSAADVERYLRLCRRHDLVATGGSDFHGDRKSNELGSPVVPRSAWQGVLAKSAIARGS